MAKRIGNNKTFKYHLHARYATDVCFEQSNLPVGNTQEASPWYSGKHELHGYKLEDSVMPITRCISCTDHARGGRSDLEILESRKHFRKKAFKKRTEEGD